MNSDFSIAPLSTNDFSLNHKISSTFTSTLVCKFCAYREKPDWNFHLILYSFGNELLFIFYDTNLHTYMEGHANAYNALLCSIITAPFTIHINCH